MTDALDRSAAPLNPPDESSGVGGFAFRLPVATPPRPSPSVASTEAPSTAPAEAVAAAWAVPPEALAGGRRPRQRPGSRAGRLFGPLLLVGLVGSMGFGTWKLVQSALRTTTDPETGASSAPSTGDTGPSMTTPGSGVAAPEVAAVTMFPTTPATLPTFRSVSFSLTYVELRPTGSVAVDDLLLRLDQVDRIGEVSDAADGATPFLIDETHAYEPSDVFGAPWTRRPWPVGWFDASAVVFGLDRTVAAFAAGAPLPIATEESINGHDVTTYRTTVTLSGYGLDVLGGIGQLVPAGGSLPGVQLAVSADANGVVIALELDAHEAVQDAAAGATISEPITIRYRQELIEWSDEGLGLTLPTNWVDA